MEAPVADMHTDAEGYQESQVRENIKSSDKPQCEVTQVIETQLVQRVGSVGLFMSTHWGSGTL